ncbi:MAG: GNAT family N-acetyltransferase [Syntrophales bacterium]|nr:GNAT family N-acetyltransferase [Syntrophales bacterium]MDD5640358.1 GNAT family N-acetyltransferase [Syntrophales bacterium]
MQNNSIGCRLVAALKATTGKSGVSLIIPVGSPPSAFLRPVATQKEFINLNDVHYLTSWRNHFVKAFLTEFQATESRTTQWLVETVGPNSGKILFMVDDLNNSTFGYMGLDYIDWNTRYGEADAIVRGGDAAPGAMKLALRTLLFWAQGQLGLQKLGVRVRSDNTAIEFYQKVGFREVKRVPLRRVEDPGIIRWVEDSSIKDDKLSLVYMSWTERNQHP